MSTLSTKNESKESRGASWPPSARLTLLFYYFVLIEILYLRLLHPLLIRSILSALVNSPFGGFLRDHYDSLRTLLSLGAALPVRAGILLLLLSAAGLLPTSLSLFWRKDQQRTLTERLFLRRVSIKTVLAAALLGAVIHPLYTVFAGAVTLLKEGLSPLALNPPQTSLAALPLILPLYLIGSFLEEVGYRSFAFRSHEDLRRPLVFLVSILSFTVIHSFGPFWVGTLLIGAVAAYLLIRTNSVIPAFVLHAAYNIYNELFYLLPWREWGWRVSLWTFLPAFLVFFIIFSLFRQRHGIRPKI